MRCKCGETVTAETEGQLYTLHRAHVALVLEQHEREAKAEAWDEGFQAGWAEAKDPGAFVNDYHDAKTPNPYIP